MNANPTDQGREEPVDRTRNVVGSVTRAALGHGCAEYQWYLKYKSNDVRKLPPWEPPITGPRNPYGTEYVAFLIRVVDLCEGELSR